MKICLGVFAIFISLLAADTTCAQIISTGPDLARALCQIQEPQQSAEALLTKYPRLVDRSLWEDVTRHAAAAYYQESPDQSVKIYEVAIQVATKLARPELLARTYYDLARTFSGLNRPENAIQSYTTSVLYFEQAGLRRDLIYVLADLGVIYFTREDYKNAKEFSERSIAIADSPDSSSSPAATYPDDFGRARALQTLAEIDLHNGDHIEAVQKLNRALNLFRTLNNQGDYAYYLAGVYSALGKVYPEMGDYKQALLHLNRALAMALATRNQNMIASVLNSIGYLYLEQEDYEQAKEQFDRSLKLYEIVKNQGEASRVLLNLGVVEQRQAHLEEALVQFKLALTTAKASKNVDVQIAAGEGIGVVLTSQRKFTDALTIMNESLDAAKRNESKTREAELEWRSAQTLYDMENFGEAIRHAESAVTLARSARLPKLEHLATTTLGETYLAQGKLDIAKETLIKAIQLLESLRGQVAGRETALQLYFENKLASYHAVVDILTQQGKPIDALLFAERAKARVLLDVVSDTKNDLSKSLTPREIDEQIRLNRKIADINDRLKRQQPNSGTEGILQSQLDTARLEYQAFQDSAYVAHSEMRLRSGRSATLDSERLNDLNLSNTAYLEYAVTKRKVWLFVFAKDSNGLSKVTSYDLGIEPNQLKNKVNLFHDRLANRHPDYADLAHELNSLLVLPAQKQLRNATLCIVPDSFLWNLPFSGVDDERPALSY